MFTAIVTKSTKSVSAECCSTHCKAALVESQHRGKDFLARLKYFPVFFFVGVLKKTGTHHRRGGQ